MSGTAPSTSGRDFIRDMVERDRAAGKYGGRVVTRFPPEPNGYPPHRSRQVDLPQLRPGAGERRAAATSGSTTRTPRPRTQEYVEAIQRDVRWLGFDWGEHLYHASDYFEQLYDFAVELIRQGQGLRRQPERGRDPRVPGHRHRARPQQPVPRPHASRRTSTSSPACGPASSRTAPTCCAPRSTWPSPNMKMRDPLLYRIKHATHYHRGDAWCIYPMYDFAHPLSDAIEGITHSLCTLEFENNREIYDWLVDTLRLPGAAAADRVRPPEPQLHRDEQAQAPGARRAQARGGLGRSAHADPRRPAPPRLHPRGDPRLLRADRRRQGEQHGGRDAPRALPARGPEPAGPARDVRAAAAASW